MLQNLHVKNLALIDEAEVYFQEGLNVLSGETGAGKSIIIGSINLALGEKVPKEMLRENEDAAFVELVFDIESEDTVEKLKRLDVEMDDHTVILSRKISGGRSVSKVNGEAVSATRLKEIGNLLIDIHGQHEHQSLLNPKKHLFYLDEYAKDELGVKKQTLAELYSQYKKLKEDYKNSNLDASEREREISLLSYEVNEITEADLKEGEDETLEEEYRRFSNGKKIMEGVSASYALTGGEGECASELIGRAIRELSMASRYDKDVLSIEEQLVEIDNLLSDVNHELSSYMENTSFDEENFYNMERRLDLINHLKSKYGNSVSAILECLEEKRQRLSVLSDYESYIEKLKSDLTKCEVALRELSFQVSSIRKRVAQNLEREIIKALEELNFLDVRFEIHVEQTENYTSAGFDEVEFLISTNPGEPVKALDKVASGGELSRIMLALKTIMADKDEIESLIFDEIDSGISGRTAQMVSEKMNLLGRNHQIICITHLPQIASMADCHFLIEKKVENGRTISSIETLDEERSVQELARMLGGVAITEAVLSNAREMKELAKSKK